MNTIRLIVILALLGISGGTGVVGLVGLTKALIETPHILGPLAVSALAGFAAYFISEGLGDD